MLTLRNTFKYQGDIKQSPFPRITLAALFPIFDYVRAHAADASVSRNIVSSDRSEIEQDLGQDSYRISAPTADLIGTDLDSIGNFLAYTTAAIAATSVSDLSFTIPIQFTASSASVGGGTLQAIYLIKNLRKLFDPAAVAMLMRAQARPDLSAAAAFLDKNILLVNKQTYDASVPEFNKLTGRNDDWLLLSVIQRFMEEADVDPGSPFEFTTAASTIVGRILQENHI
jgi:hypothetical protein